ncbi:MAG TPA: hypothetical protein V6D04_06355 [Candidatus Obscuribacterales bacterium]
MSRAFWRKLPYPASYPGKVGQILALTPAIAVEIYLSFSSNSPAIATMVEAAIDSVNLLLCLRL